MPINQAQALNITTIARSEKLQILMNTIYAMIEQNAQNGRGSVVLTTDYYPSLPYFLVEVTATLTTDGYTVTPKGTMELLVTWASASV